MAGGQPRTDAAAGRGGAVAVYFPNAEVVVSPWLLALLGLIVGTLGGFFGVGGGFLITGGLLVFGVPPLFAVGTGLTLVMGTAIINTFKHRSLGNVDFKLGALMVTGTIPAIFLAERLNSALETAGVAGPVIRYIYVVFLAALGLFILYDYWRTRRAAGGGGGASDDADSGNPAAADAAGDADSGNPAAADAAGDADSGGPAAGGNREAVSTAALTRRVRALRIPPHRIGLPGRRGFSTYAAFPVSGIDGMSVFIPVGIGFGIGFIAGLLGAGGGFILMPVLIFVLGLPTTIAIGTDLFQVIITGSVGSFLYALSDHTDPLMAVLMLAAASAGSQLGAAATRYVQPARIRFLYGLLVLSGGLAVGLEELAQAAPALGIPAALAPAVLLGSGGAMCLLLAALLLRARRGG